jgi:heat-inducible transcriptional repressor
MARKPDHPPAGTDPTVRLSDRQRRILTALVQTYVDQGEPVSSLWLAERGGFGVSSATLRNLLAQLEEMGYVHQPHTSAGRVPTDLGYRCYVDQLLHGRRTARTAAEVEARLRQAGTVEDLLEGVSRELTRVSHHMSFAWAQVDTEAFQHIDFVPLDGHRLLVVTITTGGRISHKTIAVEDTFRPVDLEQAANYLNAEFAGLPLAEVRAAILERLEQERTLYDALMARALRLASDGFADLDAPQVLVVQGASSLLEDDLVGPSRETLRALFQMIEEKDRLVRLLNEYIDGPGLTVVIGSEHLVADLQPFSLVASTYRHAGRAGTLGVIGPTRMRYSKAIAVVDSLSRTVSRVLDAG